MGFRIIQEGSYLPFVPQRQVCAKPGDIPCLVVNLSASAKQDEVVIGRLVIVKNSVLVI